MIRNYKKAFEYYELAAKQGDASAQYNLGAMYANEQGVVQNYKKAYAYALISNVNGHDSSELKKYLTDKMTNQQIGEAQELAERMLKDYSK